jgi:type II secretory pathway component PulJ
LKYKWYSYINTKRSEDNLLNRIEEIFGKNIILIYGDWSAGQQMRNFISTPNIGLKRKLNERFRVYNIDEYNTSAISCKNNEEKCKNLYLLNKEGNLKKIHAVLTFKMKNGRYGCINRDRNSVNNMKTITEYWLENKTRPIAFRRSIKEIKKSKLIVLKKERMQVTSKPKGRKSQLSAQID